MPDRTVSPWVLLVWLLLIDLVALSSAPALDRIARRNPGWNTFVADLCRVGVGGILLLHVLPHGWHEIGISALGLFVGGAVLATLAERWAGPASATMFGWSLGALVAHHLADGVGLAVAEVQPAFGLAVVLHALPIGIVAWRLGHARGGSRSGALVLLAIVSATVCGFALGRIGASSVETVAIGVACLLGGGLLHALGHVSPTDGEHRTASGLGAMVGIAIVATSAVFHPVPRVSVGELDLLRTVLTLTLASAPALVVGFAIAGLAHVIFPQRWLDRIGRGPPLAQAMAGAAVGVPVPVCSCGALPLYQGLIRRGVPATAALAFLVAAPELGVPALLVSIPLLGWGLTGTRVAVALAIAIGVALIVGSRATPRPVRAAVTREVAGWRERAAEAWRFGAVELVDHTLPWILVGIVVAALIEPLLDASWITRVPPALQVPAFAVLGMPAYVCAAGSTPLVAVLLHKGVSAGAAVAFLFTGPATNVSTFIVLRRLHGTRFAASFAVAVGISATVVGWGIDLSGVSFHPVALHESATHPHHLFEWAGAALLVLALMSSLLRQGVSGFVAQLAVAPPSDDPPRPMFVGITAIEPAHWCSDPTHRH